MGKLAGRVAKICHKLDDLGSSVEPVPGVEYMNVSMDNKPVAKRYESQYQDLFKGKKTGHDIVKGQKLSIKP